MSSSKGALKHKNFSVGRLLELREKLRFEYKEKGWFYFRVKESFAGYQRGQLLRVKDKRRARKITLVKV